MSAAERLELRRPVRGNLRNVFQPVVARLLKHLCDIRLPIAALQRSLAHRPEGEHKRASGPALPFFGQVINKVAVRARLERGIADQQCCIVPLQHFFE